MNSLTGRFCAVLALVLVQTSVRASVSYRVVALSGYPAADAAPAIFGNDFYPPAIDENGHVAFRVRLVNGIGGATPYNYECLFSEGTGPLHVVARTGQPTPGNISYVWSTNSFTSYTLSPNGQTCFLATFSGPLVYAGGMWAEASGGAVTVVSMDGRDAPNIAGAKIDGVAGLPNINLMASVAFPATLVHDIGGVTAQNDAVLYESLGSGPYQIIARKGDFPVTVPATPIGAYGGGAHANPFGSWTKINNAGVAFYSSFNSGSASRALLVKSGNLRCVVYDGMPAPGLGAQTFFNTFNDGEMSFNNDGYLAFRAGLTGAAVTPGVNEETLWLENGGALHLVARQGESAPGGGTYNLLYPPQFSGATGEIAYGALLNVNGVDVTNQNDYAIYASKNQGTQRRIFREGDNAPGMPGVTFSGFVTMPAINNSGQVGFIQSMVGLPGFGDGIDSVWLSDPALGLIPVLIRGQTIAVSPGVFKTVRSVSTWGGSTAAQDGRPYWLNNNGQMALTVTFTDATTGIVVASFNGCTAPTISTQPTDETACRGSSASFTVAATGMGPLSYQWRRGATHLVADGRITGTTSPTLTINNVQDADAAVDYNVVVTATCGDSTTSSQVSLTLGDLPNIISYPNDPNVCVGGNLTMTIGATAGGTITYQWQRAHVDIPGETGPSYTITNASLADSDDYGVIVTACGGSIDWSPIRVTVETGPVIDYFSGSYAVCAGDTGYVSVYVRSVGVTSYQWRRGGVDMPGETGSSLSIPGFGPGHVDSYDCVITDDCGSTTTDPAFLTVYPNNLAIPPQHPYDQTVCLGGKAVIKANVTESGPTYYYWYKDGGYVFGDPRMTGDSTATLTITGVVGTDAGTYVLYAYDQCRSLNSRNVVVTVVAACAPNDLNHDGHVDDADVQEMKVCGSGSGPNVPYNPGALPVGCSEVPVGGKIPADRDGDGDIDMDDFAKLQRCYSGPYAPADPGCTG